jgi:hypothetical protein
MSETRTTVKNTSGVAMTFSFLPPHGVRLANNATYSWFGGLTDIGGSAGQEPASRKRYYDALDAAIEAGNLTVLSTPAGVFYDATAEEPQVLTIDDGAVVVADPSWVPAESESESGSGS